MPIPAADCPPCTPPEVCCDSLFLLADRIRTVAFEAVLCCVEESCQQEYRSYVTMGPRIQDLKGDSVVVTMTTSNNTSMTTTTLGRQSPLVATRSTFLVELRENGWPQPKARGNNIEPPAPEAVNFAAAHSMGHAEAMWRALSDAAAQRNGTTRMFPLPTNRHVIQGGVGVGPLTPVGPQAYQVAWTVVVTVDHMPLAPQSPGS